MGEYFLVGLEKETLLSNSHLFRAWGIYRDMEMWFPFPAWVSLGYEFQAFGGNRGNLTNIMQWYVLSQQACWCTVKLHIWCSEVHNQDVLVSRSPSHMCSAPALGQIFGYIKWKSYAGWDLSRILPCFWSSFVLSLFVQSCFPHRLRVFCLGTLNPCFFQSDSPSWLC